ncbi:MAG: sigma-70 factor domain-containing protein, partial [Treponema sp.]
MDQEENSSIQKIVEYVKDKQIVTWGEIADFAGQFGDAAPDMEQIAKALAEHNLQPVELPEDDADDEQDAADDEVLLEEDSDESVAAEPEVKEDTYDKNKLVNSDKESNVDDPIRLYLREIGKENLLNAEQEVSLSKQMEEGKNIIKDVILNSGIMIPEFFAVAQKAFTKIDIHEPGRSRKEINDEQQEKKHLKLCYGEYIKPVLAEMKRYMSLKKQIFENDQTSRIFEDPQLIALREKIQPQLQKIDI